jgi:hypothetical protein
VAGCCEHGNELSVSYSWLTSSVGEQQLASREEQDFMELILSALQIRNRDDV